MTSQDTLTNEAPDLSVILVTADRFAPIRKTARAFAAQTVANRVELLIVCPAEDALEMPKEEVSKFHSAQIVSVGQIDTTSRVRVQAIRVARAPVVVLAEDHAYPEPQYAEALIEAHRGPWAGVGPAFINANPGIVSWVGIVGTYGRWVEPVTAGVMDDIPGHNSSWKRSLLLEYGPKLESMLPAPTRLNWDLKARGYQLYLEPAAKVRHVQISRIWPCLVEHFHVARLFPAGRASHWPWYKRLFYVCGMPVLLLRTLRGWLGSFQRIEPARRVLPKAWPMLIVFTLAWGAGEIAGYLFGIGRAQEDTVVFDTDRSRYVNRRDRKLFAAS